MAKTKTFFETPLSLPLVLLIALGIQATRKSDYTRNCIDTAESN